LVHGAYLTLEADPESVPVGATLTFNSWSGAPRAPSLLFVSEINATSFFAPILLGAFDPAGVFTYSDTVPSGLSGNTLTFVTVGLVVAGKAFASNPFTVAFQ
jgi:hypothetical protein